MPQALDPSSYIPYITSCQSLPEPALLSLCAHVRSLLLESPNIVPVSTPVTVCGDLHGQFWDLLELLRKGGDVPGTSYVFMVRLPASHLLPFRRPSRCRGHAADHESRATS